METKKQFVDGLFVKNPPETAPDFVIANLDVNVEKFINYLQSKANAKGYVNLQMKRSKTGQLYVDLNDWKPSGEAKPEPAEHEIEEDEEIDLTKIPY